MRHLKTMWFPVFSRSVFLLTFQDHFLRLIATSALALITYYNDSKLHLHPHLSV